MCIVVFERFCFQLQSLLFVLRLILRLYSVYEMLAEVLVTFICVVLCCTNVYVISIFVVHRHQLTAKTLLQVTNLREITCF